VLPPQDGPVLGVVSQPPRGLGVRAVVQRSALPAALSKVDALDLAAVDEDPAGLQDLAALLAGERVLLALALGLLGDRIEV
ncbi:MAG: hypothetical protein AVDCRST_MAG47-3175, partial [uncultured Nocardioidaceae bacterium]